MNTAQIVKLLQNSGFIVWGADSEYIYIEDPSCILRSFETFAEYAWIFISIITGFLLFGWAISKIRGANTDIFTGMRNLILIFGILSAAGPIVNLVYGENLFKNGCRQIKVSITQVTELLNARESKLTPYNEYDLYETLDINDTGPVYDVERPTTLPDTESANTQLGVSGGEYSTSTSLNDSAQPIKATESGSDVIYTRPDGSKYKRVGGSRAWRNNNPGNIIASGFATNAGAIGKGGRFAVFPDEATGMRAIEKLLRGNNYQKLTVAGAISKYAPPIENNTAAYHRRIQELTGLSINKRMSDLTDEELSRVVRAIRTVEGWNPGKEIAI